ncbi:hypothetical protein ACSBR2_016922 [Camellia fascicularis]
MPKAAKNHRKTYTKLICPLIVAAAACLLHNLKGASIGGTDVGFLQLLPLSAPLYCSSAVDTTLADSECYGLAGSDVRMSCFINKALVHVGSELAKLVLG